ncbi:MAG: hypothetical protein ACK4YF_00090 [Exilispira sp.]
MPKFLKYYDRILLSKNLSDKSIMKFYNSGYHKIFCTSSFNYKIVQKYFILREELTPEERLYYLFEHLSSKNYSDYPVYLFLYGDKMIEKKPIVNLFLEKEDPNLIRLLNKKIENIMKFKPSSSILVTFDNYHLIQFKLKGQKLLPSNQIENIYGIKGRISWINLSTKIRFLDFSYLKCYGTIYDPFKIWKKSFLESYNFEII